MPLMIPDFTVECAMLYYGLAGLPIIITAFYGAWVRSEVKVRIYFYYMLGTMAFLFGMVCKEFIMSPVCANLPSFIAEDGKAWACGVARYTNVAIVVVCLCLICYCVHLVKSYCEDLAEGSAGPNLDDLTWNKVPQKQMHFGRYGSVQGLGEFLPSEFYTLYDTACSSGMGQQHGIFGDYHDLNYPPKYEPGAP